MLLPRGHKHHYHPEAALESETRYHCLGGFLEGWTLRLQGRTLTVPSADRLPDGRAVPNANQKPQNTATFNTAGDPGPAQQTLSVTNRPASVAHVLPSVDDQPPSIQRKPAPKSFCGTWGKRGKETSSHRTALPEGETPGTLLSVNGADYCAWRPLEERMRSPREAEDEPAAGARAGPVSRRRGAQHVCARAYRRKPHEALKKHSFGAKNRTRKLAAERPSLKQIVPRAKCRCWAAISLYLDSRGSGYHRRSRTHRTLEDRK